MLQELRTKLKHSAAFMQEDHKALIAALLKGEAKARGIQAVKATIKHEFVHEIETHILDEVIFEEADGKKHVVDIEMICEDMDEYDQDNPQPGYEPVPDSNWFSRLMEIDCRTDNTDDGQYTF